MTRAEYIREHYRLSRTEDGEWRAANIGRNTTHYIVGSRGAVVREARALWGHFNFQDEAAAFDTIFSLEPLQPQKVAP